MFNPMRSYHLYILIKYIFPIFRRTTHKKQHKSEKLAKAETAAAASSPYSSNKGVTLVYLNENRNNIMCLYLYD